MKYYLVDTENVGTNWLRLVEKADSKDKFVLFWTKNSPRLSYEDVQQLTRDGVKLTSIACHTGPNALDFQLSSYMGRLLTKRSKTRFEIVSKDHGYDPVVLFWTEKGYMVSRNDLSEFEKGELVERIMGNASAKEVEQFKDILKRAEKKGRKEVKAYLHAQLTHTFGAQVGLERYNAVKNCLEEYYTG